MMIKPCILEKTGQSIMSRSTDKEALISLKTNLKSAHKISLSYWSDSWMKCERLKWPVELRIKIDGLGYAYWESYRKNYYFLKESFKKLKDHSNLKSLILDLHCGDLELNKDFCDLIKQLRHSPRLKKLTLNFQYYNVKENTLKIFQITCQQLRYLRQLSHLTIKTCMHITNDCFLAIVDGIHSLRNLSSFSCEIKLEKKVIPPTTIERSIESLSRFDLTHLSLKLHWFKWPHEPIQINKTFWNHLSCLKNLVSLHVSMFTQIKLDKDIIETHFQSLKSLKNLRLLSLDFASYPEKMSLEMGETLLNGFRSLGKLQLSEVYFSFPEIAEFTEKSVNGFAQCLLSMKGSLKRLILDFAKVTNLTDEEMLEFLKHLSSLEVLKSLNLRFFGKPVTDYFLKNLSFRWTFLPNLSTLNLYFQQSRQVTNQGFKALSRNLARTKGLSRLELFFGLLPNVTNASIQAFFYGFQELRNLTHLKLDFSEYEQVTDQTMVALGTGLGNLYKLQFLDLDLTYCKNLTNEGMYHLSGGFKNLTQLVSFALDVVYCPNINEESLEYWYDGLQDLPKLKNVKSSMFYSKDLPDQSMKRIRSKINGIVWCRPDFKPWLDFCELTGRSYWITNPRRKC